MDKTHDLFVSHGVNVTGTLQVHTLARPPPSPRESPFPQHIRQPAAAAAFKSDRVVADTTWGHFSPLLAIDGPGPFARLEFHDATCGCCTMHVPHCASRLAWCALLVTAATSLTFVVARWQPPQEQEVPAKVWTAGHCLTAGRWR